MAAILRLPRTARLLRPVDFAALRANAQRISSRHFKVEYQVSPSGIARLGMAVSRRVSKRAVKRNRIRRLIRECFRLRRHESPAGGFSVEALRCCLEAGFESVRFTGYVPLGGEIPPLKPGPGGEAEGYKRYQGELIDTKKLLSDYEKALKRL